MQITKSYKFSSDCIDDLKRGIQRLGFEEIAIKTEYEKFRLKGEGGTIVAYNSGKMVVQGKGLDGVVSLLEIEKGVTSENKVKSAIVSEVSSESTIGIGSAVDSFGPRIGADEVGKGDYFGPMVTAACYVSEKEIRELLALGVGDSKRLSDSVILDKFAKIHDICMYSVNIISPSEYNELTEQYGNVAVMLAKAHSQSLSDLVEQVEGVSAPLEAVYVDQFSMSKSRLVNELTPDIKKYEVIQFHKGESEISVAAASIIARAYFLREWVEMEEEYKMNFPKGATNVIDTGRKFIAEYGIEELRKIAKISFKTTASVLK